MSDELRFLAGPNGRLACRRLDGAEPGICWFGGFASDMGGTKASALADRAARTGRAFLRFDYSGHGSSEGRFEDGTIGAWRADALHAIEALTEGPQIFVGSSMGAWIALLAALARPERAKALVLIAPAVDFTEELVWNRMDEPTRARLLRDGRIDVPGDPQHPIMQALIEEGRRWLLLGRPIPAAAPVRILQGMKDADVPFAHALLVAERLAGADVELIFVKDGDHRLSRPKDLERLCAVIASLP